MKKNFVMLFGMLFVLVSVVGCASRTKVIAGPIQVGGHVQLFEESQAASFELSLDKIGFTIGHFGCGVESSFGPCAKVIGLEHSTGDPAKVFEDSK